MSGDGSGDEAHLGAAYEAMFGAVPDMVAARIRFVGEVAPRFQTLTEALRNDALGNGVLDARTVPLFLFGLLLTARPCAVEPCGLSSSRSWAVILRRCRPGDSSCVAPGPDTIGEGPR